MNLLEHNSTKATLSDSDTSDISATPQTQTLSTHKRYFYFFLRSVELKTHVWANG